MAADLFAFDDTPQPPKPEAPKPTKKPVPALAALKGAIARRPRMFPERELAVEPEEFLDDEKVMAGIVGEKAAEKLAMNAPAEEGSDEWNKLVKAANETLPETLRGVGDDVSEAEVRSLERKQDKNQVQLSRRRLLCERSSVAFS